MSSSGSRGGLLATGGGADVATTVGALPLASLTAASAVGPGATLTNDGGRARGSHALVVIASAGVTAGTIHLQGSHDNVNFANIDGAGLAVTAAGTTALGVGGMPMAYVRANITVAITGGTVTCQVASY